MKIAKQSDKGFFVRKTVISSNSNTQQLQPKLLINKQQEKNNLNNQPRNILYTKGNSNDEADKYTLQIQKKPDEDLLYKYREQQEIIRKQQEEINNQKQFFLEKEQKLKQTEEENKKLKLEKLSLQNKIMNFQGKLKEYSRRLRYYEHLVMESQQLMMLPEEAFRNHNEIDPDNMTYEQLLALQEQMGGNVSRGLTKEQISKITQFQYNMTMKGQTCSVCFNEFDQGDTIQKLDCNHCYHSMCIGQWLQNEHNCPICKQDVLVQQ